VADHKSCKIKCQVLRQFIAGTIFLPAAGMERCSNLFTAKIVTPLAKNKKQLFRQPLAQQETFLARLYPLPDTAGKCLSCNLSKKRLKRSALLFELKKILKGWSAASG
jgi:hypothetical protein